MKIIKEATAEEVMDRLLNPTPQPKTGVKSTCKACNTKYEQGVWDFYNLCDDCFKEVNDAKMIARFATLKYFDWDKGGWSKLPEDVETEDQAVDRVIKEIQSRNK